MKTRNLVTILLKLMSLYIFFQFLLMLPTSLRTLIASRSGPAYEMHSLFQFLFFLSFAYIAVSVGLFLGAWKLSGLLVHNPDEKISISGKISDSMQACAFRCFGIYTIITWGPNLAQLLCQTIIYGTWQEDQIPFLQRFYENWSVLISPIIGVMFGLLLIFKAKGLIRLIQLSRPMSQESFERENTDDNLQQDCSTVSETALRAASER